MKLNKLISKSVNGFKCHLIYCADQQYRIRVYSKDGEFVDYDILHSDLSFVITDDDAYAYSNGQKTWIDHSPKTLDI